ncbi:hypothetical protein JCM19231_3376 [Vibrio ishigakensis]|uniref:Uncharacterized protein n=1 Tax=Vibrio ishigakensis TaxID=1481914 RepID=A0A0B8P349_9VIBR|nr:hypothetical protein JCM19231_3376 [Vibrio ishigakensis]
MRTSLREWITLYSASLSASLIFTVFCKFSVDGFEQIESELLAL